MTFKDNGVSSVSKRKNSVVMSNTHIGFGSLEDSSSLRRKGKGNPDLSRYLGVLVSLGSHENVKLLEAQWNCIIGYVAMCSW